MTRNKNRSMTPLFRVMTPFFQGHGDSRYKWYCFLAASNIKVIVQKGISGVHGSRCLFLGPPGNVPFLTFCFFGWEGSPT